MKTTRCRILVAVIALCLLLTSCTQQELEGQNKPLQELSVAYMETDRASEQIIESFSSETVKLIPRKISEAGFDDFLLRHEYWVDVILIPNSTQINMTAYALDHGVRNLIPFLPEITEGVDCYPVLDAGKIGIFRYYLPLRFELPQILTTEPETDIGNTLYDALRFSGVWSADPTQKDIPVSEDVLSEYARYVKAPQDTVSPELLGAPCPQYGSDDAITADITLYAAINPRAEKKDKYLEFLRHALTTPEGQGEGQGLSVCRTAAQKYLKTHKWRAKWIKAVCPDAVQASKMPDAAKTAWETALEKVSSGSIRNAYWARIFSAAMDGYTKGDMAFEECLEALKGRLYYAPDETGLSVFELTLPEALRQEIDREKTYISYEHRYPSSNYPFDWCEFAEEKYVSGEKSYYGTFHGGIVYRPTTSSILGSATYYKLGSVEIEHGAHFDMIVFKNGVFFDLAEAYELGFITEADAAVIAERLESFEAALMPWPIETQPTEPPPSTEPVYENALTQEEIDEFKYMFTQHFNEDPRQSTITTAFSGQTLKPLRKWISGGFFTIRISTKTGN